MNLGEDPRSPEEKVESVAVAIWAADHAKWITTTGVLWEDIREDWQQKYRAMATAAIAVIEERQCPHGQGIKQGPCPVCDAPVESQPPLHQDSYSPPKDCPDQVV